jgi:hypothetical protein
MPVAIALADDSLIVREGVAPILAAPPEIEVIAACGDLPSLPGAVESVRRDVVVTDIRRPPTSAREGNPLGGAAARRSQPTCKPHNDQKPNPTRKETRPGGQVTSLKSSRLRGSTPRSGPGGAYTNKAESGWLAADVRTRQRGPTKSLCPLLVWRRGCPSILLIQRRDRGVRTSPAQAAEGASRRALYLVAVNDIAAADQEVGTDVAQIVLHNLLMSPGRDPAHRLIGRAGPHCQLVETTAAWPCFLSLDRGDRI